MRTALILALLALAGCNHNWLDPYKVEIRQGNYITPEMRAKLKTGMSQVQVRAALGAPLLSDPFHSDRWDYIYRLERRRELVENQRLTLYFEKDRLVRIDDVSMPAVIEAASGVAAASVVPQATVEPAKKE